MGEGLWEGAVLSLSHSSQMCIANWWSSWVGRMLWWWHFHKDSTVHGRLGRGSLCSCFLFMATQGGGVVSGKLVMAAARRLRVT